MKGMVINLENDKCWHCKKTIMTMQGAVNTDVEGEQVTLCGTCWNKHIAKYMGTDFETIELKPITLIVCSGKTHAFHFFTHLVPPGLEIDAREILSSDQAGYEFSVLGPHGCNQSDLILDLYAKIKRGLSKRYLKKSRSGIGIKDRRVVGRIEWDDTYQGEIPRLIIDGLPITWNQFGKMLMSFEGWNLKLDILDRTEE
jgi:hypothetical protein